MRRSRSLTPLLALAGALSAAIPGCDPTIYAQATGYVKSYVDSFEPRHLVVEFDSAADMATAQAIVDGVSTDAIVTDYNDVTHVGLVETPPGYSLDEISTGLELLTSDVVSAIPDYVSASGTHLLVSEGGTREIAWLRELGFDLQAVAYEYIVRVSGAYDGQAAGGVGVMDVESLEIVSDRVVRKGGTVTLVVRGVGDTVVVLVDALRDEAWELVGTVADVIAGAVLDGTLISVTGTELLPSLTSRAGGLSVSVASYDDLDAEEVIARTLVDTALLNLDPLPGGTDEIWFLPVELASGAVVTILAEFDLPAVSVPLSESGYLVFIDGLPGTAWPHAARIVFVKTADATTPTVLFPDRPAMSLSIKDAAGDPVTGPWVVH